MKPDNVSTSVMLGKSLRVKLWELTGAENWKPQGVTLTDRDRQKENTWMKCMGGDYVTSGTHQEGGKRQNNYAETPNPDSSPSSAAGGTTHRRPSKESRILTRNKEPDKVQTLL